MSTASCDLSPDAAEDIAARLADLRRLHDPMDQQVLLAYGWDDVDLEHDFHVVDFLPEDDLVRYAISKRPRRTVLHRLQEFNFHRHAEKAEVPMEEVEGYEVLAEKTR